MITKAYTRVQDRAKAAIRRDYFATMARGPFLFFRKLRDLAFHGVALIDGVATRLNGKHPFPPIYLRREIGPLPAVEMTVGESAALLAVLADATPSSRILDVGCGPGMLVYMLRDRLGEDGRYLGLEVSDRMVRWANRHLGSERISFSHHNYWNATYNPSGERFQPLPVVDGWADIVVMKSVITHMLPDDVDFYIRETARVLRVDGTALVTAFLYSPGDESVSSKFPHEGTNYRYLKPASPESAIALDFAWLSDAVDRSGLTLELRPGYWRSLREPVTTYQDLLILKGSGHGRAESAALVP